MKLLEKCVDSSNASMSSTPSTKEWKAEWKGTKLSLKNFSRKLSFGKPLLAFGKQGPKSGESPEGATEKLKGYPRSGTKNEKTLNSLQTKNAHLYRQNLNKTKLPFMNIESNNLFNKGVQGAQQFLSYQGKDSELFIDLHPPKNFGLVNVLNFNESVQQPVGSLVCQIFSGLLSKQISKNILIVSPLSSLSTKGTKHENQNIEQKTLLVQAIAGETELKIITDNAYRYAMVYRGVAVGIKLLRDVFDSLALHTPCLFLIEDIHAIGERRPLLISDDENTKGTSAFGSPREEVPEYYQILSPLSHHVTQP